MPTVAAAIGADARFADTSVWVTTSRHWVTLQGCVRSTARAPHASRRAFVRAQPNVERVFDDSDAVPGLRTPDGTATRSDESPRERL